MAFPARKPVEDNRTGFEREILQLKDRIESLTRSYRSLQPQIPDLSSLTLGVLRSYDLCAALSEVTNVRKEVLRRYREGLGEDAGTLRDIAAFADDWRVVGEDLRSAMKKHQEEQAALQLPLFEAIRG